MPFTKRLVRKAPTGGEGGCDCTTIPSIPLSTRLRALPAGGVSGVPAVGRRERALRHSGSRLPSRGAETGNAQVPSEVYGLTQSARPRSQTPAAQPKAKLTAERAGGTRPAPEAAPSHSERAGGGPGRREAASGSSLVGRGRRSGPRVWVAAGARPRGEAAAAAAAGGGWGGKGRTGKGAGRAESRVPEAAAARTEEGGEGGWGRLGAGAGASPRLAWDRGKPRRSFKLRGEARPVPPQPPRRGGRAEREAGRAGRAGASWGRRSGRCGARAAGGGKAAGGWSKWRS